MNKASARILIKTPRGLHATPACMLAQTAKQFRSRVTVTYGRSPNDMTVNAKSLIAVVAIGARMGESLEFNATGEDAFEAIAALVDLIERRNFDGE